MKTQNTEVEDSMLSRHTELNYYEPTVIIKEKSKIRKFFISPITVAIGIFIATLGGSYHLLSSSVEEEATQIAKFQINSIKSEIDKYEKFLKNISAYLENNGDVSPNDFIKYAQSFDMTEQYPALLRIDYLNVISKDEQELFYNNLVLDYENLIYYPDKHSQILEMIAKNKIINEKRNLVNQDDKKIIIKYIYPTIENSALIGDEYVYIDRETFENSKNNVFSSFTFRGISNSTPKSYKTNITKKLNGKNNAAVSMTIDLNKQLFNQKNIEDSHIDIRVLSSEKDGKRIVYETETLNKNDLFDKTTNVVVGSDVYEIQILSNKSIFVDNEYIKFLLLSILLSIASFIITRKIQNQKETDVVLDSQAIEDIESQLRMDDLTKLLNRRACQQDIKKLLERHNINDKNVEGIPHVSLVFIDLDGFKRINDTLGHSYGDTVLIEYGYRLKSFLGNIDGISFYRLGGDEFTVVLDGYPEEEVRKIVEGLSDLTKEPFSLKNENYYVTQSMGVSTYPTNAWNKDTLFKNADIAMYEAKKSGKNCFMFFNQKISDAVDKKNKVINNINEALEKDEFHMMYQPKFKHVENGKYICTGVEALVRWENEKLGNVRPDLFIPVIEEHGLINEVTEWILKKICEECQVLKNIEGFKVSINLSAKQLSNLNLADEFSTTIAQYNLKNEMFVVEITETTMMKDAKVTKISLDNFNKLGFAISVDDFGTGYSSLSYLRNFPVDELKIDKSFTDMVLTDLHTQIIVEGIMNMCQKLNMGIVVEGVETLEQIKWLEQKLLEKQSIEVQGYYFSKPLLIKDLIKFCFTNK